MSLEVLSAYFVVALVSLLAGIFLGQWLARKAFHVVIRPYLEVINEGRIFKTKTVKLGYQYQCLANGAPCFQPHVVIEQTIKVEDLDTEKLKEIGEGASKLAAAVIAGIGGPGWISLLSQPVVAGFKAAGDLAERIKA